MSYRNGKEMKMELPLLNRYELMWMLVLFDLPVVEKKERLKYTLKWRVYFILQFALQTCLLFARSHFIANAQF